MWLKTICSTSLAVIQALKAIPSLSFIVYLISIIEYLTLKKTNKLPGAILIDGIGFYNSIKTYPGCIHTYESETKPNT